MDKRTCLVCGDNVPSKGRAGPQATYCSPRCRQRADYLRQKASGRRPSKRDTTPKACPQCGDEFIPERTAKQRFCSPACCQQFSNATWRSSRGTCSEDDCGNKAVSRGLCRQHHPTASTWSKAGDPETRRANLRRKTQQRRARTKGDAEAELIDRDEIGDRDGWRCGLCTTAVDRSLPYPHPRSASLDHIVPLSLHGKHIKVNVQIAHLDCNVAKGNRVADVQLLLIG